ncbi:hypothetical protein [Actinophytocola algeriensis]|uniref:Uncharacterized protein n=1 Tax=Actinophytocola algeriensis TaxID=1768010 RepID=A0A7W7QAW1_9PSEU|nr:hypothetical protein [Actinophytocola algeriensis]MBB4910083.1 hypothetical protein [Actinophytocola algeriensis]MBE1476073.1 hypothetical protein [Actinophytocola algeriensis]
MALHDQRAIAAPVPQFDDLVGDAEPFRRRGEVPHRQVPVDQDGGERGDVGATPRERHRLLAQLCAPGQLGCEQERAGQSGQQS